MRHGDFRHGGGSDGARAGCGIEPRQHPLAGNTDRSSTGPKNEPRHPRGMPPGRPRWPPAEPRPRSRASVPGALLVGERWPAAGISWRAAQTRWSRPNEVAALIAATSAAPKGRTSPSLQFHLHDQLPDPLPMSSSAFTGSPLRSLSEASIPANAHAIEPENLHGATKVPPARKAKAAAACASPSTAGQVPAGLQAKENVPAKLDLVYHRPINSNPKLSVMFRLAIKPIPIGSERCNIPDSVIRTTRHSGRSGHPAVFPELPTFHGGVR